MEPHSAESRIRTHWLKQDYQVCAVIVLECYGTEVYSFLLARFHGRPDLAEDAFSEFSEDLWRSLPSFGWRCAMRSWCYRLSRSAATRVGRAPHNRRRQRVTFNSADPLSDALERARTSTAPYLRTEIKDEFAKLRDSLSGEDRELLTLRIDRRLPWREISHILSEDSELADAEAQRFEAALRQRFGDIKKRIRRKAEDAGLL